jgi:hypothetical protein
MDERIAKERLAVETRSRVQLRPVLAGLAVTAGCLAVCLGLGWAIGLSAFHPTGHQARALVLGNSIWGAIAFWISMLIGAYVAAFVARADDTRDGVLHGLVVWGTLAAFFGLVLLRLFADLLNALLTLGSAEAGAGGASLEAAGAVERFAHVAGLTLWLYWAGIIGGAISAIIGGRLGARGERAAPARRVPEQPSPAPITPKAPQPA